MNFKHAVVRIPGKNFSEGITTSEQGTPDFHLMQEQHREYIEVLKKLGLDVTILDPLTGHPDAHFVEDTAVITPEIAVITNPGAVSRKGEEDGIEVIMSKFRKTKRIKHPGTLDGGDILQAGRHFFIGMSQRTNEEGARQLSDLLNKYGYSTDMIPVGESLHLKSDVNYLGKNKLLLTGAFSDIHEFSKYDQIIIKDGEEYSANTLEINGTFLTPRGFPHTLKQLLGLGKPVIELDMSEPRKMDGGLTCMSLRF